MPDERPDQTSDEPRPIPPRYRWLKRIALVAVIWVVALLGLRVWWGCEADRRLQAAIAAYRAAGEPVLLEDFAVEPVPDKENGAYFLQRAAAGVTQPPDSQYDATDFYRDPNLLVDHADEVAKLVEANLEPLQLIRTARFKATAVWNVRLRSPLVTVSLPGLSQSRHLARFATVAARYRHQCGEDAAALETARDILGIGAHTEHMGPLLITHLVRVAIDALAVGTLEAICPDLCIGDGSGVSPPDAGPATPAQVQALIAELLDERGMREDWARALHGERMMCLDTAECIWNGRLMASALGGMVGGRCGSPAMDWRLLTLALKPAWKLDAVRMMEFMTDYAHGGLAPSWPAARRLSPSVPETRSGAETLARMLSRLLLPSMSRATELHFNALANRRLAATALAIRLYELDHGRRPAALSELVPDYLSAVPPDPFAANGREISYVPDGPQPVLYSVSLNGVDEGGRFALGTSGGVKWDEQDLPFFLNGDRPHRKPQAEASPPPSSAPASRPASRQTVPDDQDVEHAQGNGED